MKKRYPFSITGREDGFAVVKEGNPQTRSIEVSQRQPFQLHSTGPQILWPLETEGKPIPLSTIKASHSEDGKKAVNLRCTGDVPFNVVMLVLLDINLKEFPHS